MQLNTSHIVAQGNKTKQRRIDRALCRPELEANQFSTTIIGFCGTGLDHFEGCKDDPPAPEIHQKTCELQHVALLVSEFNTQYNNTVDISATVS